MLVSVAIANVAISILCFYGVWRVCQLRRALVRATVVLDRAERTTHTVLLNAPEAIASKQMSVAQIRHLLRQIDPALNLGKQLLMLVGLLQGVMSLGKPPRHPKRNPIIQRVLPKFR
jgi:hypothetical protein